MTVAWENPIMMHVLHSINLRSAVLTALGTTLLMSLMCSLSLQAGHADVPIAIRAMKQGAHDFLQKPYADDELLASVRSALELGRQIDRTEHEKIAAAHAIDNLTRRWDVDASLKYNDTRGYWLKPVIKAWSPPVCTDDMRTPPPPTVVPQAPA